MGKLQLNMPAPCSNTWEQMKPTACGAYCNSCQKEVVDFTGMSDRQIAAFFQHSKGKVCGRFREKQLLRPYYLPEEGAVPWKKYLLAAVLFTGVASYAKSQTAAGVRPSLVQLAPGAGLNAVVGKLQPKAAPADTIQGRVVEASTGAALPGAVIRLKHTKEGVVADMEGKFILNKGNSGATALIEVSFIGYKTKELTIEELRNNAVVAMEEDLEVLGEVVMVGGVHIAHWWSPRSIWWKIKGVFR